MKKLHRLIFFLSIALMIVSCNPIEDLNGSDTSLSQITEAQLLEKEVNWNAVSLKEMSFVNHSGILPSDYYAIEGFSEQLDLDHYRMQVGSASGITNLVATRLEAGESVMIVVESEIEEGNLAIVLLEKGQENHQLVYQFQTGTVDIYKITAEQSGIYYVRAGVESFAGSIEVNRSFSE